MPKYLKIILLLFFIFFIFLATYSQLKIGGLLARAQTVVIPVSPPPASPKDSLQLRTFPFITLTPTPEAGVTGVTGGAVVNPAEPIAGDAQSLAKQILANKNISLQPQARSDIQAAAENRKIQNSYSCGKAVSLHPALLKLMLDLAQNHKYTVGYIITQHRCNTANHPKGRAMDLWQADGKNSWQNSAFRQDAANLLPRGGGLGQRGCPGSNTPTSKNSIRQFADSCNHQHIDVGTQ